MTDVSVLNVGDTYEEGNVDMEVVEQKTLTNGAVITISKKK
ncbi:hypothetical protein [Phosphitispora fastidiosa]|nr:hypothetical protein [Phosphitispora fastidiosa]MBU7006304.1 hypothetical protein [Phosphitispora fastidiosa]